MKKAALFAYNGEFMCFIHVLLNALDMHDRGYDVKIVIEGAATKLVPELAQESNPMFRLYEKARGLDLIDGACKACSNKMGVIEEVKAQGLRLLDEMSGHPSMARYIEEGFEIITF
ncbi:MAG: DsrE family protein [Deltaproteobacteria bacterium]|nr:DsrE family protein [Deltaproteobacteria bacterium]MBW2172528.1 DsrE family protein [Deltaproteobacteria bacterium]